MTFLAQYHQDNLLNPVKLLTHREDILAVLEETGIAYERMDLSAGLRADQTDIELLDNLRVRFGDYPCAEIVRLPALPSYAAPAAEAGEPEQRSTDAGLRLILQGSGVFCLHSGDALFALGCGAGDLVSVPAGVGHWFRKAAGPECVVVRLARSAADLKSIPSINGLADKVELPEM